MTQVPRLRLTHYVLLVVCLFFSVTAMHVAFAQPFGVARGATSPEVGGFAGWILAKQAEFYRLGRDRVYHLIVAKNDGELHSAVLKGLWIKPSWLWQKPLPSLRFVMEQWKLLV